jgi:hypothetical protein
VYASRLKQAEYAMRLKREVLAHYSPNKKLGCSCPQCPITALELLSIDHVLVSGKFHRNRRGHKLTGLSLYRWLRDRKFPPGYQTLCLGCNGAKGQHPTCPLAGKNH